MERLHDKLSDVEIDEYLYGDDLNGCYDTGDEVSTDEPVDAQDVHFARLGEHGGEHGLVHEDGTRCDAKEVSSCPEEKKSVSSDLLEGGHSELPDRSEQPSRDEMMSRATALHDAAYLRVAGGYYREMQRMYAWMKKTGNPKELYPAIGVIRQALQAMRVAGKAEQEHWNEDEAKGIVTQREWYDSKKRRIVSEWHQGVWRSRWDLMSPRDAASIQAEAKKKFEALNQKRKEHGRNPVATQEQQTRFLAKRIGVSSDVYKVYGDQFKQETGRKYIVGSVFRAWLEEKGIPKDWRLGQAQAKKSYLDIVSKSGAVPSQRSNTLQALMAKFIKPVAGGAAGAGVSSTTTEQASAGQKSESSPKPSNPYADLVRSVVAEAKRRAADA